MDFIDKIVSNAKKVSLKCKHKCSWFKCKKEIKEIVYTDQLLTLFGFLYCSREHMEEHLRYPITEEAIRDSAESFL